MHEDSQLNSNDPTKINILKKRIFAGEKDAKISKSPMISVSKNSSQLMEGFSGINKHALSPMIGLRPLEPSKNQKDPNQKESPSNRQIFYTRPQDGFSLKFQKNSKK